MFLPDYPTHTSLINLWRVHNLLPTQGKSLANELKNAVKANKDEQSALMGQLKEMEEEGSEEETEAGVNNTGIPVSVLLACLQQCYRLFRRIPVQLLSTQCE